jgi:hypothetical protein
VARTEDQRFTQQDKWTGWKRNNASDLCSGTMVHVLAAATTFCRTSSDPGERPGIATGQAGPLCDALYGSFENTTKPFKLRQTCEISGYNFSTNEGAYVIYITQCQPLNIYQNADKISDSVFSV